MPAGKGTSRPKNKLEKQLDKLSPGLGAARSQDRQKQRESFANKGMARPTAKQMEKFRSDRKKKK